MSAKRNNGVHPARTSRRLPPANDVSDNACQYGRQPSPLGSNGDRPREETPANASDDACHSGTQPSPHGSNRDRASDPAPSANADNGRDTSGRFAPGNKGGPGNPFGRLMAMLRCALCRRIKPEDVEAIANVLIAKAKEGDVPAARLVLSYGIGKPTEAVNPDTLDLAEWDIYRQGPVSLDDLRGIVEGIPLDVLCPAVRAAKPYLNASMAATVKNVLMPDPPPKRKASRKERRAAERRRRRQDASPAAS